MKTRIRNLIMVLSVPLFLTGCNAVEGTFAAMNGNYAEYMDRRDGVDNGHYESLKIKQADPYAQKWSVEQARQFGLGRTSKKIDLSRVPQRDPNYSTNIRCIATREETSFEAAHRLVTRVDDSPDISYIVAQMNAVHEELYSMYCSAEGKVMMYRTVSNAGLPVVYSTYMTSYFNDSRISSRIRPGDLLKFDVRTPEHKQFRFEADGTLMDVLDVR